MHQIDWHGNDGRANYELGTIETANCGICSAQMNVEHSVLGATSRAEAAAGKKHRHNCFTCPNLKEEWHRKIYLLKIDMYKAEINQDTDYEERKIVAEKEIIRILETHAAR